MSATSIDLSQIKTDALSAASTFRTLIGLGTGDTPTFKATTLSTGTITASTPAIDISQTWNNAAVAFTGLKLNATDTASSASSLLMDLQVGGTSKTSVTKAGAFTVNASASTTPLTIQRNGVTFLTISEFGSVNVASSGSWYNYQANDGNAFRADAAGIGLTNGKVNLKSVSTLNWSSTGNWYDTADLTLARDAANTLAQRNSTSAQTFRIYRTADGSPGSNYQRLALSSTTYSGASYQTILCESAGTGGDNINLVLSPKGTGAFSLRLADGTTAGGNARGQYAVDLQMNFNAANQVASGNYSVAIGYFNRASSTGSLAFGSSNISSGLHSVAIGIANTSSSDGSVAIGFYNTASGLYGSCAFGRSCTASGSDGSLAIGYASTATRSSSYAFASGLFASAGDAQKVEFVLRIKTTDATATTLMLDGSTTRLTIPSGKVFAFVAKISGIKSDGSAVAFYTRKGAIKNVGGTTSLVGSIETIGTDTEDNTSTDVAITADDTNDALQINVTGIAAETWRWVAVVEGVEIGYGT